ncbi:MAG: uridine kinase [Thermoanaerobaculales bacterium]|nr:uridine kinase [Thermoanaerobaculales bacterium]
MNAPDLENRGSTLPLCIGVAGGTGSGKTTVAHAIVEQIGASRIVAITQDRYYKDLSHLPLVGRTRRNFDHPEAIESGLLEQHLKQLKASQPADLPLYDFSRHVRLPECERVQPRPVILVEGILILALTEIRDIFDVKVFVDTDSDIRFIRRLSRDMSQRGRTLESVVQQYQETVRPMHLEFVEPSRRWADVIIPEGGFNTVALSLVISHIEKTLAASNHPNV